MAKREESRGLMVKSEDSGSLMIKSDEAGASGMNAMATRPVLPNENESTKRLLFSSRVGNDNSFVKRLRGQGIGPVKKDSIVIVRVGQQAQVEFTFVLLPLVTQSTYFKRHIESMFHQEQNVISSPQFPLVIDLPHFPCSLDIFRIVQDFCSGGMEEIDISITNVVALFDASEFLEMENLRCRVWNFLEEKVFNSFESCLSLLATFDCDDLPLDNEERSVIDGCTKALLHKIAVKLSTPSRRAVGYNVNYLQRVSSHLSGAVADYVYESLTAQLCDMDFLLLFEEPIFSGRSPGSSIQNDVICSVFFIYLTGEDDLGLVAGYPGVYRSVDIDTNALERWIPPAGSQVISHGQKLKAWGTRMNTHHSPGVFSSSKIHLTFISGHLVHQTKVYWYDVFENVEREKEISSQEALELRALLDSDDAELSQGNLKKLFEELHLDCGPRFVKIFLEMQQKEQIYKKDSLKVLTDLRTELSQTMIDKQILKYSINELLQMERVMILEKAETDKELDNLRGKLIVKTEELDNLEKMKKVMILEKAETDRQLGNLRGKLIVETEELQNLRGKLFVKTEELISVTDSKKLLERERVIFTNEKRLLEMKRGVLIEKLNTQRLKVKDYLKEQEIH